MPDRYSGADVNQRTGATERETPAAPLPAGADFAGHRALVIDDDKRNIFAISSSLESRGMAVISATNGKDGIRLLQENPDIHLVIMDVMMPQMDGMEATRIIREIPQFKRLPIICLTAKAMKGDRDKCLEAGASDYITKPVDPEKLFSRIFTWLNKSRN